MGVAPTSPFLQSTTTRHACPRLSTDTDRGLKKSATFHSPKSPASGDDPIVNIPLLSRRSPTSPQALQDAVAASEERVAQLLGHVDRSLSGLETFSTDSQETLRPDEHPVPRFMLGKFVDEDRMDTDPPTKQQSGRNRHLSDSGIGSSVTGSESADPREDAGKQYIVDQSCLAVTKTHLCVAQILADLRKSVPFLKSSGINGTSNKVQHTLSAYACRQIQKHLVYPILKEETLKSFHPLVSGIPARVGRKEITCLRDLEKVLLYLAPVSDSHTAWEGRLAHCFGVQRFTESRSAFVRFCEASIQCLHTTVEHLNESDQRRPSDRPYTNSYFLDLTEQVRQYAAMISAARERMAAGVARPEDEENSYAMKRPRRKIFLLMSNSKSKLSLEGGIGRTGQPAQLVRTTNERSISMLDGEEVDLDVLREEARRSGAGELDEDTLLSMARRRKNAEKIMHRCSECDKEFKRPCDLTKHEKTHSRPWKCSDSSCKYAEYGWPTEKERDRHMNDKHSAAPAMFKCQYHPCPYESKRESNCKQHMEKAHGWAYVRSKNNGKKGRKQSNSSSKSKDTPPTPQSTTPGSHIFEASGSEFDDSMTSPYMQMSNGAPSVNGSIASTSPYLSMNEAYTPSPFEPHFTFNQPTQTLTPQSPFTPASHHLSFDPNAGNNATLPSAFNPSLEDEPLFNGTFDWSNMDTDFTSMNIQLFTPATSIDSRPVDAFHSRQTSLDHEAPKDTKLSPGAQGQVMLYTPQEQALDETFGGFMTDMGKPTNDFALFDDSGPATGHMSLFEAMPPFQSQTWVGNPDSQMMMEE